MNRSLHTMLLLMSIFVLQGCVTSTTGGFNVKRSDADALRDYLQLAAGYLEQNDLPKSKQHLANAANIDPNNSEIHAIWGLVYAREGEAQLADASFQQALRSDSANSKARNNYAAFLFAQGHFEGAYEQLERVVADARYEGRPQAFENLGLSALRLNRLPEAELAFSRALQLNPNQMRSSLELVGVYLARADLPLARNQYANYLTLLQLYRASHSARSLWIGIQLEAALGNKGNVESYGKLLETSFATAPEFALYKQFIGTLK